VNRERQQQIDNYSGELTEGNGHSAEDIKRIITGLSKLATLEEAAVSRMKPHSEKAATAVNINKGERVIAALYESLSLIEDGEYEAAGESLGTLAGMAAPRRKMPEFTEKEDDVWPATPPSKPQASTLSRTRALYDKWEQEEDDRNKLQDPDFQQWLKVMGHTVEYDFVREEADVVPARPAPGRSNRPEDY